MLRSKKILSRNEFKEMCRTLGAWSTDEVTIAGLPAIKLIAAGVITYHYILEDILVAQFNDAVAQLPEDEEIIPEVKTNDEVTDTKNPISEDSDEPNEEVVDTENKEKDYDETDDLEGLDFDQLVEYATNTLGLTEDEIKEYDNVDDLRTYLEMKIDE